MKRFKVTVNGQTFEVAVEELRGQPAGSASAPVVPAPPVPDPSARVPRSPASSNQAPKGVPAPPAPKPAAPAATPDGVPVKAPMPGVVTSLKVKEGDEVKEGDVLLILEAMKMENEIPAPANGKVKQVKVSAGQSVGAGETLVVVG